MTTRAFWRAWRGCWRTTASKAEHSPPRGGVAREWQRADGNLLLLDIHLGGISGIELQRRLAASGSKCPVIFMTASDDEATHNEAMDAGCIAYLRKPFARQVLLNAIGKAVA
jgi:FixJ family two-component response regulator